MRSLKRTLQMDVLRCQTPELVRKEIWTHLLAYHLSRTLSAQAASNHGLDPRSISFQGAMQTLEAFQPVIALQGEQNPAFRSRLSQQLLDAVASHRVADRPDRYEPRLRKRRPKHYGFLRKGHRLTPRGRKLTLCSQVSSAVSGQGVISYHRGKPAPTTPKCQPPSHS
ncbi:MAG TPA: hypothetical protein VEL76_41060, partial [Gemmataceae bacterium]|nr:hypothetical protein [Gemmataceae bacterium]